MYGLRSQLDFQNPSANLLYVPDSFNKSLSSLLWGRHPLGDEDIATNYADKQTCPLHFPQWLLYFVATLITGSSLKLSLPLHGEKMLSLYRFLERYLHLRSLLPHFSITPPPTAIHFHPYHITEISLAKHTIWHNLLEIFYSLASTAPPFLGVSLPLLSPQFALPTPLFLSPFLKCCLSPSVSSPFAQDILPGQLNNCICRKHFSDSGSQAQTWPLSS